MAIYVLAGIGLVALALGWIILADMMRHAASRAEAEAERLLEQDIEAERAALQRRLGARP